MIYKIFKNNEQINIIVANEEFVKKYCELNNYTYKLEERHEEIIIEPPIPLEEQIIDMQELLIEQQFEIEMLKLGVE